MWRVVQLLVVSQDSLRALTTHQLEHRAALLPQPTCPYAPYQHTTPWMLLSLLLSSLRTHLHLHIYIYIYMYIYIRIYVYVYICGTYPVHMVNFLLFPLSFSFFLSCVFVTVLVSHAAAHIVNQTVRSRSCRSAITHGHVQTPDTKFPLNSKSGLRLCKTQRLSGRRTQAQGRTRRGRTVWKTTHYSGIYT